MERDKIYELQLEEEIDRLMGLRELESFGTDNIDKLFRLDKTINQYLNDYQAITHKIHELPERRVSGQHNGYSWKLVFYSTK